jgi:ankyrin repeat protein
MIESFVHNDIDCERLFQYAADGDKSALEAFIFVSSTLKDMMNPRQLRQQKLQHLWCCRNKDGASLLHYAAGNGHYDVCHFLLLLQQQQLHLKNDEKVVKEDEEWLFNVKSIKSQRTALHWAARNGHLPVVKLLVAAMKQHRNPTGYGIVDSMAKGMVTPLQLCVWQGHVHCVRWLIEQAGANPTLENGWGCTLAHWLAKSPIYGQARAGVEVGEGANVNDSDHDGTTDDHDDAVHFTAIKIKTAWNSMWKLCDYFHTTLNMDWTLANYQGQTPLHKAAFAGNMPVLTYLVHHHLMLDSLRDNQLLLAADCAERGRQFQTATWLRLQASPLLWIQSYDILFGKSSVQSSDKRPLKAPAIGKIRHAYRRLVQQYHPDRQQQQQRQQQHQQSSFLPCDTNTISPSFQSSLNITWSNLQDAYTLWMAYWNDPLHASERIRQQTRHKHLQQLPPLLKWQSGWHDNEQQRQQQQQQQQMYPIIKLATPDGNIISKERHSTQYLSTTKVTQQLQQNFDTNLVRLLQTLPQQRVALSQLPKEYYKTYHQPIVDIKLYQCKKLGYYLEKYCHTSIEIVCQPKNITEKAACIKWVQLRTRDSCQNK